LQLISNNYSTYELDIFILWQFYCTVIVMLINTQIFTLTSIT